MRSIDSNGVISMTLSVKVTVLYIIQTSAFYIVQLQMIYLLKLH